MNECCKQVLNELEKQVYELRGQSFECWTPGQRRGYDTATASVLARIALLKNESFEYPGTI